MLFGLTGVGKSLHFDHQEDDVFTGLAQGGASRTVNVRTYEDSDPTELSRQLRTAPFVGLHLAGHGGEGGEVAVDFRFGAGEQGVVAESWIPVLAQHALEFMVLSVCHSAALGEALKDHVDCVISAEGLLKLSTARHFDRAFYAALGRGESVRAAFEAGKADAGLPNQFHGKRLHLFEREEGIAERTFPFRHGAPLDDSAPPVYIIGSERHRRAMRRLQAHLVPTASYSPVLNLKAGDLRDRIAPEKLAAAKCVPFVIGGRDANPPRSDAGRQLEMDEYVGAFYAGDELVGLIQKAYKDVGSGRVRFFPLKLPNFDPFEDETPYGLRRVFGAEVPRPADYATAAAKLREHIAG